MKGVQTWAINALKAIPLNANNLTPLLLMVFLALELVFLFIPDDYVRAINIIVSSQYALVFYAGYKAKPEDKELFYPFALYFLYVTGMYISGIGR